MLTPIAITIKSIIALKRILIITVYYKQCVFITSSTKGLLSFYNIYYHHNSTPQVHIFQIHSNPQQPTN